MRAGGDLVRVKVLGEEQVAQDIDWIVGGLVDQLAEGVALPAQILGSVEIAEPDVPESAGAGEKLAAFVEIAPDPVTRAAVREALLRRRGPPAWTHGGSMIRRRVLAHSAG